MADMQRHGPIYRLPVLPSPIPSQKLGTVPTTEPWQHQQHLGGYSIHPNPRMKLIGQPDDHPEHLEPRPLPPSTSLIAPEGNAQLMGQPDAHTFHLVPRLPPPGIPLMGTEGNAQLMGQSNAHTFHLGSHLPPPGIPLMGLEANAQLMGQPGAHTFHPGPHLPPPSIPTAPLKGPSRANTTHSQYYIPPITTLTEPPEEEVRYKLSLRQQPKAARACGIGDRDRRMVDPPPILELTVESSVLSDRELEALRLGSKYVVTCSILDELGQDVTWWKSPPEREDLLIGMSVASSFIGRDEHGKKGCFFVFPDLTCRMAGAFYLEFRVANIDPKKNRVSSRRADLAKVRSDLFRVYNPKNFPGLTDSTPLVYALRSQGLYVPIKRSKARSIRRKPKKETSPPKDQPPKGRRRR